jgi:hypothetical protein
MQTTRPRVLAVAALAALAAAAPAAASFHLMQIEQVAGGFCGNRSAQAIQLRMRSAGQNLVSGARLVAFDAAGASPVVLLVLPSNVANSTVGSRILLTTAGFAAPAGGPAADFTLAAPIPASYLAAGRLTWEAPGGGTVYWSLAWGGGLYTGATTGQTDNDPDGEFGPPFAGALPATGDRTLQFQGAAGAASSSNGTDYAPSASPATLTDNAGSGAALATCLFYDGFEGGDTGAWSAAVP